MPAHKWQTIQHWALAVPIDRYPNPRKSIVVVAARRHRWTGPSWSTGGWLPNDRRLSYFQQQLQCNEIHLYAHCLCTDPWEPAIKAHSLDSIFVRSINDTQKEAANCLQRSIYESLVGHPVTYQLLYYLYVLHSRSATNKNLAGMFTHKKVVCHKSQRWIQIQIYCQFTIEINIE